MASGGLINLESACMDLTRTRTKDTARLSGILSLHGKKGKMHAIDSFSNFRFDRPSPGLASGSGHFHKPPHSSSPTTMNILRNSLLALVGVGMISVGYAGPVAPPPPP